VDKYLARRWKRAQQYTIAQVNGRLEVYDDNGNGSMRAKWYAPSTQGGEWDTHATIVGGTLTRTLCTCPDYGECTWMGIPVCKHTLALALFLSIVGRSIQGRLYLADTLGTTLSRTKL